MKITVLLLDPPPADQYQVPPDQQIALTPDEVRLGYAAARELDPDGTLDYIASRLSRSATCDWMEPECDEQPEVMILPLKGVTPTYTAIYLCHRHAEILRQGVNEWKKHVRTGALDPSDIERMHEELKRDG